MPAFINKSWPLLLMPIWWLFWLVGLIFHNCHFAFKNKYKHVKAEARAGAEPEQAKEKKGAQYEADSDIAE